MGFVLTAFWWVCDAIDATRHLLSLALSRSRKKPSLLEALKTNKVRHLVLTGDYAIRPIPYVVGEDERLVERLKSSDPKLLSHRERQGRYVRKLAKFTVDAFVFGTKCVSVFALEKPMGLSCGSTTDEEEYDRVGWDVRTVNLFMSFLVYYLARHNTHPLPEERHKKGDVGNDVENNHVYSMRPKGNLLVFGCVNTPELGIQYQLPQNQVNYDNTTNRLEGKDLSGSPNQTHHGEVGVGSVKPQTVTVLTSRFLDKLSPALEKSSNFIVYLQDRRNGLGGYMTRLSQLMPEADSVTKLSVPHLIEIDDHDRPDRSFPIVAWPGVIPSYSEAIPMPQLLIVFSKFNQVEHVPPVALLRSELLFLGELKYMSSCLFARALVKYAKTKQRYGK